ncbi:MAG TPA: hypothetical protein VFG38_03810, partial [Pseudomonadales bacterium]|nr:hypothetical protein [Pseudomonadales bacterium]
MSRAVTEWSRNTSRGTAGTPDSSATSRATVAGVVRLSTKKSPCSCNACIKARIGPRNDVRRLPVWLLTPTAFGTS